MTTNFNKKESNVTTNLKGGIGMLQKVFFALAALVLIFSAQPMNVFADDEVEYDLIMEVGQRVYVGEEVAFDFGSSNNIKYVDGYLVAQRVGQKEFHIDGDRYTINILGPDEDHDDGRTISQLVNEGIMKLNGDGVAVLSADPKLTQYNVVATGAWVAMDYENKSMNGFETLKLESNDVEYVTAFGMSAHPRKISFSVANKVKAIHLFTGNLEKVSDGQGYGWLVKKDQFDQDFTGPITNWQQIEEIHVPGATYKNITAETIVTIGSNGATIWYKDKQDVSQYSTWIEFFEEEEKFVIPANAYSVSDEGWADDNFVETNESFATSEDADWTNNAVDFVEEEREVKASTSTPSTTNTGWDVPQKSSLPSTANADEVSNKPIYGTVVNLHELVPIENPATGGHVFEIPRNTSVFVNLNEISIIRIDCYGQELSADDGRSFYLNPEGYHYDTGTVIFTVHGELLN